MTGVAQNPPSEVVIGLDVGTTAAKAVAFGLGSTWRYTAIREYPLLQPEPGWQVQDPATIAAEISSALTDCVTNVARARVLGISVSAAMHGLIGLDAGYTPLTPLVTWADARSHDEARWLRESGHAVDLNRASCTPVHPMTPLTKLMWFVRHEPELCKQVRWWVGLKDYVLLTLTGTLVTELSSASGTGLLDLRTRSWSAAAVDIAGISVEQLPTILPTTSVLRLSGACASDVALPTGTPVVVGAADGPLGNLGAGAMGRGLVGLSVGTSGAVRIVVPAPVVDTEGRLFCYALTDDAWVLGGAVSNGGVVVRWAGSVFGRELTGASEAAAADTELLAVAGSVQAGSDGLLMLPYLLPERAPLWDPDLSGAYLGVRHAHTRAHFVRAAVEGVALQLSMIVDQLDRIEPVTSVRATGGVFRSQLWREVMAGALGRPLHVTGGAEGSALGAAALGLFALGRATSLSDGVRLLSETSSDLRPSPVPTSAANERTYAQMRAVMPALLGAYGHLSRLSATAVHDRGEHTVQYGSLPR